MPRRGRYAAAVVAVAAFTFFGGYERLREGVRKPFLIHSHLFSNGLLVDDIGRVNTQGMKAYSGWVGQRAGDDPMAHGREVFRAQCSSCHTLDGYQAIRPLLPTMADMLELAASETDAAAERVFRSECASCHPDYTYEEMREAVPGVEEIREDPEFVRELSAAMILATVERLRDMGQVYTQADRSTVIDTHETRYPHMPPAVGTDEDLEALAAYLASLEGPEPVAARTTSRR